MFFTVPSPIVEVSIVDTVEYGQAVTLECNIIAVRGITSIVDISWIRVNRYNYATVRTVENVTANIVNNSAVYTDQLVTPPLSVNDRGTIYYCGIIINSTFGTSTYDMIILNFTGKYLPKKA